MYALRKYQEEGIEGVKNAFKAGKRKVLLVMPTGAGKTVCFSWIAQRAAEKGQKVLILAHRIELLEQCGEKLTENGLMFGYMNPKYTANPIPFVQVGTCQTVVKRMEKMNFEPNLIIIDEAHRSCSKTYRDIIAKYPNARVLGVTATPVRGDGKPLGDIYEVMVIGPSIKQLMLQGALVRARTYAPDTVDFSDATAQDIGSDGDYKTNYAVEKMNKPSVTGDAVDHYRRLAHNMSAVIFCCNVQHAKDVAAEFKAAGYLFEHIDGTMDKDQRKDILRRLKSKELHGITSVDLVTEGFDAPILQVAIILRPTLSLVLYIQMAGRVLRLFLGKEYALILDHANCTKRHGLITAEQEWSLTGIKKGKRKKVDKEPLIKWRQCPKCFLTHDPKPICPSCGHVYVVEARTPQQIAGELKEITEAHMAQRKIILKQRLREAKDIDSLYKIADDFGFHWSWAEKVWGARNNKLGLV